MDLYLLKSESTFFSLDFLSLLNLAVFSYLGNFVERILENLSEDLNSDSNSGATSIKNLFFMTIFFHFDLLHLSKSSWNPEESEYWQCNKTNWLLTQVAESRSIRYFCLTFEDWQIFVNLDFSSSKAKNVINSQVR